MSDLEKVANALHAIAQANRKLAENIGCAGWVLLFVGMCIASAIGALK